MQLYWLFIFWPTAFASSVKQFDWLSSQLFLSNRLLLETLVPVFFYFYYIVLETVLRIKYGFIVNEPIAILFDLTRPRFKSHVLN